MLGENLEVPYRTSSVLYRTSSVPYRTFAMSTQDLGYGRCMSTIVALTRSLAHSCDEMLMQSAA